MKTFLIIMSLWGYDGTEWIYVGNQYVNQEPMTKEECLQKVNNWVKYENNEYYRLSIECKKI